MQSDRIDGENKYRWPRLFPSNQRRSSAEYSLSHGSQVRKSTGMLGHTNRIRSTVLGIWGGKVMLLVMPDQWNAKSVSGTLSPIMSLPFGTPKKDSLSSMNCSLGASTIGNNVVMSKPYSPRYSSRGRTVTMRFSRGASRAFLLGRPLVQRWVMAVSLLPNVLLERLRKSTDVEDALFVEGVRQK